MGVPNRPGVDAALQDAGGKSGDTADIGAHRHILRGVELILIPIVQVQLRVHLCGVDAAAVLTLDDGAVVLPGDAAHIVLPSDRAGEGTVDDLSPGLVDAHDPADAVRSAHPPGKRAVGDGPLILPHQAAQGVFAVGGGDAACDVEIPHGAAGLYVPEQAPHIAAAGDRQPGDGVALPLKGAAEGGNGDEIRAGQVDVRLQIDSLSLGPAVQGAVPGQRCQVLRRAEIDGIGAPSRQSGGGSEGEEQNRRQKEAQEFTDLPFHCCLKPPWSDSFRSPACRRRRRRSPLECVRPPRRRSGPGPGRSHRRCRGPSG